MRGITDEFTRGRTVGYWTGDYPEVKARLIEKHLTETQRQAEALQGCIKGRGGDTSTLKDMAGKMVAFGHGSYTFEHMEAAAANLSSGNVNLGVHESVGRLREAAEVLSGGP